MGNFFRNGLIKLANTAILFGTLLAGYGAYETFTQRNVAGTATAVALGDVANHDELLYASVDGGTLDLQNTMISELQTRRGRSTITTNYYVPVKNDEGKLAYILQTEEDPSTLSAGSGTHTGLLQSGSGLSNKIKASYEQSFPGQELLHLDATHKTKSMGERFGFIGGLLALVVGAFFLRKFLINGARRNMSHA